jgi:hypothetical protein
MISHHLTQIYQQLILKEAASITDDIKQAMINSMDDLNKRYYKILMGDVDLIMKDEPIPEETLMYISTATLECACKHALRIYKNIDVVAKKIFDYSLDNIDVTEARVSWWGLAGAVNSYTEYCNRLGKEPVIVKEFIKQVLQNVEIFKRINKWDAAVYIVGTYFREAKKFDEQLDTLVKNEVMSEEYTSFDTRDLLASYYAYYTNTLHKPCKWIDMMICNAPDAEEALSIYNRIGWMRNKVAPAEQKHIYNTDKFIQQVCN